MSDETYPNSLPYGVLDGMAQEFINAPASRTDAAKMADALAHAADLDYVLVHVDAAEMLPTDEQEVPREKWATISPGVRVRVETKQGTVCTGLVDCVDNSPGAFFGITLGDSSEAGYVDLTGIARVWVLDEPNPDADLIERMAQTIADNLACDGVGTVSPLYRELATKALAVVREAGE